MIDATPTAEQVAQRIHKKLSSEIFNFQVTEPHL